MKIPAKALGGAFTLLELLVIIAMVAVLVVFLAPALASTKDHAQRASCANNLREQGLGVAVYAEHYDGRYPISQAGNNQVNRNLGGFYTRFLFFDSLRPSFHLAKTWDAGTAPDNPDIGSTGTQTGTFWRNFGMLYPEKLAGDGSMFYCPALNAKGAFLSAANYQPLLTTTGSLTDSNPGSIRGAYIYNPWVNSSGDRLYANSSDVKGRKVFGMDFIDPTTWNSDGTVNAGSINFAHSQAKGWNVLFSDNSADFKRWDRRVGNTVLISFTIFSNQDDIQGINQLCGNIFER